MSLRRTFLYCLTATLVIVALIGAAMAFFPNRPTTLSRSINSQLQSPSVMRLSVNGVRVVSYSIRGQNDTGGTPYKDRWNDELDFELYWYDILAERAYAASFTLEASTLPTFGGEGEHASIHVLIGPGADVTVTTSNPEAMRLIGLNRTEELTADMLPVVLRELCARPVPPTDPIAADLASTIDEIAFETAMGKRERHLARERPVAPRCPNEGGF